MGDNIKIAAVVVTYNRLDLMKKCVNALRKQSRILNTIFVINNMSCSTLFNCITFAKFTHIFTPI